MSINYDDFLSIICCLSTVKDRAKRFGGCLTSDPTAWPTRQGGVLFENEMIDRAEILGLKSLSLGRSVSRPSYRGGHRYAPAFGRGLHPNVARHESSPVGRGRLFEDQADASRRAYCRCCTHALSCAPELRVTGFA